MIHTAEQRQDKFQIKTKAGVGKYKDRKTVFRQHNKAEQQPVGFREYYPSQKSQKDTISPENMVNNTSAFDDLCVSYDTEGYRAVTILSASMAAVSALACILVTLGIVCSKKYLVFTQRLILYLSIAATLNATAEVLRLHIVIFDSESNWVRDICMATGFFDQVSEWWQLLAVSCITLSVLVKVVWRGTPERVEPLFPAIIFLFPISINWIPFINYTYGRAGAWCWIRDVNSDCSETKFGQYLRFALWYVPLYTILVLLVLSFFVIFCKIRSEKHRWQGRYDPDAVEEKERMKKEIWPLLWYPAFYIFLNVFALANRLHGVFNPDNPILALWVLHAIFSPLQGGFVSVAYALDSDTIRRLNCIQVLCYCYRKTPQVREYPHEIYQGPTDSLLHGKSRMESEEM